MRLIVNIDVDDLERGLAFYQAAFGLVAGRRFGPDAIELLGLDATIYLLAKPSGSAPYGNGEHRVMRDYKRHWTPVHIDVVVEDLPSARDRAVAAGATLEGDIEHHPWGSICYLADPFGHGFCLLRFHMAENFEIETRA